MKKKQIKQLGGRARLDARHVQRPGVPDALIKVGGDHGADAIAAVELEEQAAVDARVHQVPSSHGAGGGAAAARLVDRMHPLRSPRVVCLPLS